MRDIANFNLLDYNTFGIDAHCSRFLEFDNTEELSHITHDLLDKQTPFLILGGGSNLLLTKDFNGTVIHSAIKGRELTLCGSHGMLRCGSGEKWDDIVAYSIDNGLYGLENLSWIPGDVGACAVQNIGAYGVEAKDYIHSVEAVEIKSGDMVTFSNNDCSYAYRSSKFKKEWKNKYIITHVTFKLNTHFTPQIKYGNIETLLKSKGTETPTASLLRESIIEIRKNKLPDYTKEGNAGSFFINPIVTRAKYEELLSTYDEIPHYPSGENMIKIPAGWLIERCGLKGYVKGNVGVHSKQALVIVNKGGATGAEVVSFSRFVQDTVRDKFGIALRPEVNII